MQAFKYFVEATKSLKTVGTVTFSSKFLVNKMLEPVVFKPKQVIIELGAGNGCITKELLNRMHPDSQLFSFEVNENFCTMLNSTIQDERLHLINDSAEHLTQYLHANNIEKVDYIISSVPLVVLPEAVSETIMKAVEQTLKNSDGTFIHLSYSPFLRNKFKQQFNAVKLYFSALNLPPAWVYACKLSKVA
ncbi:MAG: methyltransferase [Sphingobacteriales bacterium]|jgi:phospholipid N-methyltransferase|nr:methyltransferase [Sphingobacteriales bacterium]MBP9142201.1 methyltransferase [Chitinophagales bacterium]MDA0199048.1 methyltransferase [Bacteroidota bacterium]